jgi:DNA-binding transcriptional regulator GbsR (MarR family)
VPAPGSTAADSTAADSTAADSTAADSTAADSTVAADTGAPGTGAPGTGDGHRPAHREPAAVRRFIERFTALLAQAGFPRTPARIFVALLTADDSSLTAAQLADLLQTSPASVSSGARYLVQVGLITAEGEPGSRRQHYRMSVDVWQDIVSLRDRQFTRWASELTDGVRVLGPDSPAGQRMAETVRYFQFISAEMAGLLERWRQRDFRDGD